MGKTENSPNLCQVKNYKTEFFKDLFFNIQARGGWIYVLEIDLKNNKRTQKYFTLEGLMEYIPTNSRDVYFGTFIRGNRLNGKAENCTYTNTLWADIDDLDLEEINKLIEKHKVPQPSAVISTGGRDGNSFHLYWILDKPCSFTEIRGILTGLGNKIDGDPAARKKDQIMRLPGSTHNKKEGLGRLCRVMEYTGDKYSLDDFKQFNYLQHERKRSEAIGENLQLLLDRVDWPCVKNMLMGVPESERNFALYRIVAFLKHKRPYTRDKVKQIVKEWNKLCSPPKDAYELLKEFKGFWEGEYKLGCKLPDPEQQRTLEKYCNEKDCPAGDFFKIDRKSPNDLPYNNRIFYDNFKTLPANAVVILGVLISFKEGLNFDSVKDKLTNNKTGKLCISVPKIREALKALKSRGWIERSPAQKRLGRSAFYKYKPQNSFNLGETLCSYAATLLVVNDVISPAALKLYLLLCKYGQMSKEKTAYPSFNTLAEKLGLTRQGVGYLMSKLTDEGLVSKIEIIFDKNKRGNLYRCLV